MAKRINGIQQLGVGVTDVKEGFRWYRKHFGMDIKMFEEAATAELMLAHTENKPRERHAILALNMQGGGGFEIWQHTGKTPAPQTFEIQLGDWGICIGKLKSSDLVNTYEQYQKEGLNIISEITQSPAGSSHFYLKDLYGYVWEVLEDPFLFSQDGKVNGGIFGVVIGCKNIDDSLKVYQDILGYDQVLFDQKGKFEDWTGIPGSNNSYRRVILAHSKNRNGSFSPLLGPSQIELVQVMDREAKDVFDGRIWGDPGYIHLCFDINGMDELREEVKSKGFPFTVDSAKAMETFDMGEAAGNFAYIQAPEGTLIEFVETHKIPLLKKIGWYLNLAKRGEKPLPRWMFSAFKFMREK